MIVIDRARVAATPKHPADRDELANTLIRELEAAGQRIDDDHGALLRAAIIGRELTALPELLASAHIRYGHRLAHNELERRPGASTPAGLSPPPRGRLSEQAVVVALGSPRPPVRVNVGRGGGPQTTGRQTDGSHYELPRSLDGARAAAIRALCTDESMTCPFHGCPDPRLTLRAGTTKRPHFAHRPGSGVRHDPADAWLLRAIGLLQRLDIVGRAVPATHLTWTTDRGTVRIIGPRSRLTHDSDAALIVLATTHLRFANRAKTADGRWADLIECPEGFYDGSQILAVDDAAERVWVLAADVPSFPRSPEHLNQGSRLRLASEVRLDTRIGR